MQFDENLEQALRSAEPVAQLRTLVLQLISQGHEKPALLGALEEARQRLRRANREADEDAVMDAMDFLVGWCSPHMKLPPDQQLPNTSKTS